LPPTFVVRGLSFFYPYLMWVKYNNNPTGRSVEDCAVRAVSIALGTDWETAYTKLAYNGYLMGDMPSANAVWGSLLRQAGYSRSAIPDTCPDCYTVKQFCQDHPVGTYVLAFDGHVAVVQNGDVFDSWDSTNEIPQFYWYKKEKEDDGV